VSTLFYIDGSPRTGETFLMMSILQMFDNISIHKFSKSHNFENFTKVDANSIITIRNPKDALISWISYYKDFEPRIIKMVITKYYLNPLKEIYRGHDNFFIADFDEFTTDFKKTIGKIEKEFKIKRAREHNFAEVENNILEHVLSKDNHNIKNIKDFNLIDNHNITPKIISENRKRAIDLVNSNEILECLEESLEMYFKIKKDLL